MTTATATPPTLNRDILKAELIRDEGLKLRPYHDTLGLLSIGVGRNLDRGDGGITPAETKRCGVTRASCIEHGISRDQAMILLDSDIDATMAALDHVLPWWRTLDPVRQRVMVNLGHMGIGDARHGLLSFTNTLAAIKAHRWDDAANGLLSSKYATQVGARATRLAAMLRTGKAA
jgi:lysozyme